MSSVAQVALFLTMVAGSHVPHDEFLEYHFPHLDPPSAVMQV